MKAVYIYPTNNSSNKYSALQEEAVKSAGCQLASSFKQFFKIDAFILNWFEQLGSNEVLEFIKKLFKILLFVVFNKNVYVVMHNKTVHTQFDGKKKRLSFILNDILFLISKKIIILCDESKNVLQEQYKNKSKKFLDKTFKIPHPNYISAYGPCPTRSTKKTDKVSLLFVGLVKKYKNIELLIDCMNELQDKKVQLTIAGSCQNEQYAAELKDRIKNKNVVCDFRFVPDAEICQLMQNSDLIVLPYDISSSLNSGSVFLAFSNKKTVLCPLIGSLKEYKDRSFFYTYEYASEDEHKEKLMEQIMLALDDAKRDPLVFEKKGLAAYHQVEENNSLDFIAGRYKELLES